MLFTGIEEDYSVAADFVIAAIKPQRKISQIAIKGQKGSTIALFSKQLRF